MTDSPDRRVRAVMWNLRIDAATGEVVEALSSAGVDSLILKGPALAEWYPPDSGRTYVDADVWVAPAAMGAAESVLTKLGFKPTIDEQGLPDWWQEHASSWLRAADQGKIDLHRRLQGVGTDPQRAWDILWRQREPFTVGGRPAQRLPEAGRALYVALHATHHGVGDSRALPHLQAALDAVEDSAWRQALALAIELRAVAAFATGLRMVTSGASLAERLEIPDARSVRSELLASSAPPVALGFDQLAAAHGVRRFQILLRKFVPPPSFIRHWWSPAAASRRMLLIGYLYRPVWLVIRAPGGYRSWRAARRRARSSS